MQGIFLNCSTSFGSISDFRLLWSVAHFFRFVRNFWSLGGGSCYQNSVKACPTIQSLVWSQRFWSVEISDVSSPFSNTALGGKKFEIDIPMKMPRHLVIELDSAQFWETSIKEYFEIFAAMHSEILTHRGWLLPGDRPDQILFAKKGEM